MDFRGIKFSSKNFNSSCWISRW